MRSNTYIAKVYINSFFYKDTLKWLSISISLSIDKIKNKYNQQQFVSNCFRVTCLINEIILNVQNY